MGFFLNERYGQDVFEDIGFSVYDLHTTGIVEAIARLLFNPRLVYVNVARFGRFFTNAVRQEVKFAGNKTAEIHFYPAGNYPQSRNACLFNRGILRSVPQVCGLPPAEVREVRCCVNYLDPALVHGRRFKVKGNVLVEEVGPGLIIRGSVSPDGKVVLKSGVEVCSSSCVYEVSWEKGFEKERIKDPFVKENLRIAVSLLENYEEEVQEFIFGDDEPLPELKVISFSEKYRLTPREREVLFRLLIGKTTEEISSELNISVETVRHYRKSIFRKAGVHSYVQLIARIREEV